jgi:hypothetical protein
MRALHTGLCAICHRQPRGFGWFNPHYRLSDPRRDTSRKHLCSRTCQDICHGRKGMIDPTPNEAEAMTVGGQMGGEYLESIGKSDLATLTETEWDRFIDAVVTGYCDHLRELAAKDRKRFDAMTPEVPF